MTEAAQFQTTIIESAFNGIAPVYRHYAGQHQPQPAYIRMDEDGEIDTWINGEIGNATPSDVWHGRTQAWRVPADARGEALLAFVKDHQRLFERVWQGHKVEWNGNNWVGKTTEDAKAAYEEIEAACSDIETIDVTCMQDWLRDGHNHFTDFWDGEHTLDEAASKAEDDAREALSEGVWVKDPHAARSELLEWAADEFRNHPERLSACHFEALIAEGEISFEDALEVIEDEGLDIGLYKEVNEAGTKEILHFLQANHKRGGSIKDAADAKGWIEDASFQLAEGNAPTVEVGAEYSTHGYAVTYTVSDAGVSVRAVQH